MRTTVASRRAELLDRCRRERNEFIASTARTLASLPRPRDAARAFNVLRRVSRIVLRAVR